jgi:hypothetical protein
MFIFQWLNNQLLKMQWLSDLAQRFVEQVLGLSVQDRLGGSIHFFLYDVIKIFILLSFNPASTAVRLLLRAFPSG